MADEGLLNLLRQRTALLVGQRLRSDAMVISRLADLIQEAVRLGHAHRAIHDALTAGGLATSWNTYRVSLRRARKAQQAARASEDTIPVSADGAPADHSSFKDGIAPVTSATRAGSTSTTVDVLDALQRARRTASKDYSRIVRDQLRQRTGPAAPGISHPKEPS